MSKQPELVYEYDRHGNTRPVIRRCLNCGTNRPIVMKKVRVNNEWVVPTLLTMGITLPWLLKGHDEPHCAVCGARIWRL